jgi:hypothetical protein
MAESDRVLQPHELAERGLAPLFGQPPLTEIKETEIMDFRRATGQTFTPQEDVLETLPDGRVIQVGAAGMPMPLQEAQRMGVANEQGEAVAAAKPAKEAAPEAEAEAGAAEAEAPKGKAAGPSEKK